MDIKIPKVSVVIPTYNQGHFITEAIHSVLTQTYDNYEIIVIDDGSTDDTQSVVRQFGTKINYLYQENQGLAGARNTGIYESRGEFVALLDSDDIWLPSFLEEMMSLAEKDPDATVYYCGWRYIDSEGNTLPQAPQTRVVPSQELYHFLLRANFIIPSAVVMRRFPIMEAGLFDPAFRRLQDKELWLRLLREAHKFFGSSTCLVNYRVHGNALSADPIGGQRAALALVEKHFGLDDGKPDTWSSEKRRAYGGLYRYCLLSSIQHQDDWQSGVNYLRKALQLDPTLAEDLDLFYDLALASQPIGYRGSNLYLNLDGNADCIEQMLLGTFQSKEAHEILPLRGQTYSMAWFAMGLAAYNTGDRSASRRFLSRAAFYNPKLWCDPRIIGIMARSFLSQSMVNRLRRLSR